MRPLKPSDIGHLHECCDGRDCTSVQAQVLAEMIADIAPQAGQRAILLGTGQRPDKVASEIRLHLADQHRHHDCYHSRYHEREHQFAVVQLVLDRVAVDDDFLWLAHAVSLS